MKNTPCPLGILLDIHGVLLLNKKAQPFAVEFINYLNNNVDIDYRLVTNMAWKSRQEHFYDLNANSMNVDLEKIFTPVTVAKYILEKQHINCTEVLDIGSDGFKEELFNNGFNIVKNNPELIIIPKLEREEDFEKILNFKNSTIPLFSTNMDLSVPKANSEEMNGAASTFEKLALKDIPIIGKPNPLFFKSVIEQSNLRCLDYLVIGDSIETDFKGANNAELDSIIVKSSITGKSKNLTNIYDDLGKVLIVLEKRLNT